MQLLSELIAHSYVRLPILMGSMLALACAVSGKTKGVFFVKMRYQMFFNRNSPVFTNYFKDKRFVITGGASGLGLQLAEDICSYGGSVTLISRNIEKLEKATQ